MEQLFYLSDLFGVAVFAITGALMAGRAQVTLKPRLQPAIGPRPTEAPAENRQLP